MKSAPVHAGDDQALVLLDSPLAAEDLIAECRKRNVGTMIIKSVCKAPWGERTRAFHTWYEPFNDMEMIQPSPCGVR